MLRPLAARQRLTAAATLLATLTVTLTLLAGMPYVLWQAAGIPWPTHASSLTEVSNRLLEPISDPLMVQLLAVVGWMCWAAFTYTVIRETLWYAAHLPHLLRDRTTHHTHVATLSIKGSLAALCIGTLFIAALGLWRPQTAGAQQPSPAGELRTQAVATAPLTPAPDPRAAPHATVQTTPTQQPFTSTRTAPTVPPAGTEPVRLIEYVVAPGDTLWDIAHTHLGDALKWPRIYKLNKDRIQPDGGQLSDPDLIMPGWQLTLPATQTAPTPPSPAAPAAPAPNHPSGPPTSVAPAPSHPSGPPSTVAPTPSHSSVPSAPTRPAAPSQPPATPAPARPALPPQPTPAQHGADDHAAPDARTPAAPNTQDKTRLREADAKAGPAAIGIGTAGLIGITAAAGLLAARRYWHTHQNRRRDPDTDADVPALSPLVDKAAQAAHAATQPQPLEDPDALIKRRTPPQQPHSPATVTIGVQDNTEVTLNTLAIPGGCTWTGPGTKAAARALLTGILTAAERQRPRPPHIKAVVPEDVAHTLLPGLPPQFTALTQTTDTAAAIRTAEQHLLAHARTEHETEPHPAHAEDPPDHTGTHTGTHTGPGTLVLLAVPDAVHSGQLQALAARSRPGALIVLTLGADLPGAERWQIAADGTTTRPRTHQQHTSHLQLFHLTPEAGHSMTAYLLTAHGQHPRPRPRTLPTTNAPHQHTQPPSAVRNPEPEAEPETDTGPPHPDPTDTQGPTQTKPVRLHVLGPITLYARGNPDPVGTNLRPEVHEFLALLAAHPTGLLATDIADKLQIDSGSIQNGLKNLRRAVRRTLRTATGITAPEFILRQGELHKLHPELVETDLEDFTQSLKNAFAKPGPGEEEKDALVAVREALAHYRGPFAQGSDYLWADAIREHLAIKATDAALRLAHQAEHATEPHQQDAVLTLLEHLATAHPDHERLAQHTIRLYQATGRHDAARHTYTRLKRHLADLDLEPDQATQALLALRATPGQTR